MLVEVSQYVTENTASSVLSLAIKLKQAQLHTGGAVGAVGATGATGELPQLQNTSSPKSWIFVWDATIL